MKEKQKNPPFAELAETTDAFLAQVNYILLHEYGHSNGSDKKIVLQQPVKLFSGDNPTQINLLGINGLDVEMIDYTGFYKNDKIFSEEALIDTQAFELSRRAGNNTINFTNNDYRAGRQWVSDLNSAVGIDYTELAEYVAGKRDLREMLVKWGGFGPTKANLEDPENIKFERGLKILAIIGLQSMGILSLDDAHRLILLLPLETVSPVVTATPTR